ncbi:hypothetical protein PHYPSEUDO_013561 [Phytophthora pseudosyringae]|uniref:Uncharacterized protein n=1 Tax=Phytophthora pseudosyringae TaxID=221518 RepID=A0A8T1W6V8_9STRA|nr:hypothetical protein PHYPSEUDO_013561 [Phytophthora pseudosyringae]
MLGGAPLPSLNKDGLPSDALAKLLICLMDMWGLVSEKSEREHNDDGLLKLCVQWNSINSSFINKGRYQVVENILRKSYRCARNEKTCSEWRSRNADLWTDQISVPVQRSEHDTRHSECYEPDREAEGMLLPEDIWS